MDRETLEQTLISIEPRISRRFKADRAAVEVPAEALFGLLNRLCQDTQFLFDMLLDHTAIDRITEGKVELVYNLYSTSLGHHLMVSCFVGRDKPVVPTVEKIWPIAHWQEREAFDLFGILYDGHSDLRRVFLEDNWQGYPLRKDYKDSDMLEFSE